MSINLCIIYGQSQTCVVSSQNNKMQRVMLISNSFKSFISKYSSKHSVLIILLLFILNNSFLQNILAFNSIPIRTDSVLLTIES